MRPPMLAAVIVSLVVASYGSASAKEPEHHRYEQVTIKIDRPSPTIDMTSYTLITDDAERDRPEATELMRVKADLPRAVQTKDKALFESILARDFTFRGEDQWYERDAYIRALLIQIPSLIASNGPTHLGADAFGNRVTFTIQSRAGVAKARRR
jgi:hypothetical protein